MKIFVLMLFTFFSVASLAKPALTQISPVNLTSAGTAQRVSATSVKCSCVVINALAGNTGAIYVGDSAVTATNGLVLAKGDSVIMCAKYSQSFVDLHDLYFDGGTTNDDIKVSCGTDVDLKVVPKPI